MLRNSGVFACTLLLACNEPVDVGSSAPDGGPPPEPPEQVTFDDPCGASDFTHPTIAPFRPATADAGAPDASLDAGTSPYSACPIKEVDVSFQLTSSPIYTQGSLDAVGGDRGEAHVVLPTGAVLTIADGKTLQRTPMLAKKNDAYNDSWIAGERPSVLALDRAGTVTLLEAENGNWRARTVSTGEEFELPDLRGIAGEGRVATGIGPASGDAFVFVPRSSKLLRRTGTSWSSTKAPEKMNAFALGADDRPYFADRFFVVDNAGTKTVVPHLAEATGPYPSGDDVPLAAVGVSASGVLHLGHVADDLQLTWFPSDHAEPSIMNLGGGKPTCVPQTDPCNGSCEEPYAFVPISAYSVMTDARDRIWVAYLWAKGTRTLSASYHAGGGGITIPGLGTIGGGAGCSVNVSFKPNSAEIVIGRLEGSPPALVNVARIPTAPEGLEHDGAESFTGLISFATLHASLRDGKIHITRLRSVAGANPTQKLQHVVVNLP